MRVKKHFNPRVFWITVYFSCFVAFLIIGFAPVEASSYRITAKLEIPSISLVSDVARLDLNNRELNVPTDIVGSYNSEQNKILLVGHSSSIFDDLDNVWIGDEIIYNQEIYHVTNYRIYKKENVDMNALLSSESRKTLILMTCIGTSLPNNDATHRLVITAEAQ